MSFNYLATPYYKIPELNQAIIRIDDSFQDFPLLEKYKYIAIDSWNREYPLPPLPNGVIALEFNCMYSYPLNNLPNSLEVLYFEHYYDAKHEYLYNLPSNLYQLIFNFGCFAPLNYLPESLKVLHLCQSYNQSSANLPIGLKVLSFSHETFSDDEIIIYPPGLEILNLDNYKSYSTINIHDSNDSHIMNEYLEEIRNLEHRLNFANLPVSLKILHLPRIKISNLNEVMLRLTNIEQLHISSDYPQLLSTYPPNIKSIYMNHSYDYELASLPASLTYLKIGIYYEQPLECLLNSNLEHLNLDDNKTISVIDYLPKSLRKLSILETHPELYKIMERYPELEIDKLLDWDYQESLIDYIKNCEWF